MSLCVHSLRGTAWGSNSFLPLSQSRLLFVARSCGNLSSGTVTLGWGAWCGSGSPRSWDTPSKFLSTTHGWGASLFHVCAPPTSLDGCGFFNSVVVRLPFNKISDGSEWWLFYILVIILMWMWEEESHVCLCCHLDQKEIFQFFHFVLSWISLYAFLRVKSWRGSHSYTCFWVFRAFFWVYIVPLGCVLCIANEWTKLFFGCKQLVDCMWYFPSFRKLLSDAESQKKKKQWIVKDTS